jgi:hypothetical protein
LYPILAENKQKEKGFFGEFYGYEGIFIEGIKKGYFNYSYSK